MTIEIQTLWFGVVPGKSEKLEPGERVPFVRNGPCGLPDNSVPKTGELTVISDSTVRLPGGELVTGDKVGDKVFKPADLRKGEINLADLRCPPKSGKDRQGLSISTEKIVWKNG